MKKRLSSLFLLLVLIGSAFAGVPLHSGESECGMSMMDMDCCKAALLQQQTPEVADAKLCCALNCSQSATTSPVNSVRVSPPSQVSLPAHPASTTLMSLLLPLRFFGPSHGPPKDPQPAYIRHLALLI
jgi:hypothetical protein